MSIINWTVVANFKRSMCVLARLEHYFQLTQTLCFPLLVFLCSLGETGFGSIFLDKFLSLIFLALVPHQLPGKSPSCLASLINICYTKVQEVFHGSQIIRLQPSHINQWMTVFVPHKNWLEKWAGGCQDHFVGFNLMTIPTGQGHINKVSAIS